MRSPGWLGFRGKTLWDWLQLLIVPAILIGVTFAWSATQSRSDNRREDRRSQDATLQAYLDQMSGLMLDKRLLSSPFNAPVRSVARTVTLTTLRRLEGERKAEVVRFLHEAGLIDREVTFTVDRPAVVDLTGGDLTGADLEGADLEDAVLTGADLTDAELESAILSGTNLTGADLRGVDLRGADLQGVDLEGADLTGADLTGANVTDANLVGAILEGARNLNLGKFIARVPPEQQKAFLDSQKAFLDSLSPDELAKFNLTPETLAEFRQEATGG
jgi:uncharacterized protein YjbI with pentapeptide repeats